MLFHELLFFFSEQQKLQQFQFSIFDMHSFCQKKVEHIFIPKKLTNREC